MKVMIDSGELPNAEGKNGAALFDVIRKWQAIASLDFPFDCTALLEMIEQTDRLRLWEKNCAGRTYPDRDSFLRHEVLLDYELTEEHFKKVIEALKGGREPEAREGLTKAQQRVERDREIHRLRDEEKLSQREIAERVGLSQPQVCEVLAKKPPEPLSETVSKTEKPIRDPNARTLYLPQEPTVAALKIRQKFGDEFANALKEAL